MDVAKLRVNHVHLVFASLSLSLYISILTRWLEQPLSEGHKLDTLRCSKVFTNFVHQQTSYWLKQDMTSRICASKTLSMWMNIILKFVESDHFSSSVARPWPKRISRRRPIRHSLLLILSCDNNIGLRSSLSSWIWSLFYFSLKRRISRW